MKMSETGYKAVKKGFDRLSDTAKTFFIYSALSFVGLACAIGILSFVAKMINSH